MASNVQIANSALTKLGAARIMSLSDNKKEAREINAIFELRRDHLLRSHNWSFAMERTTLPALDDTPPPSEAALPTIVELCTTTLPAVTRTPPC